MNIVCTIIMPLTKFIYRFVTLNLYSLRPDEIRLKRLAVLSRILEALHDLPGALIIEPFAGPHEGVEALPDLHGGRHDVGGFSLSPHVLINGQMPIPTLALAGSWIPILTMMYLAFFSPIGKATWPQEFLM